MLYISCPTCGYFLGNITQKYEKEKERICSDDSLSEREKAVAIQKLIKSLKLRRYCCKMRMLSYKNLVDDILPTYN